MFVAVEEEVAREVGDAWGGGINGHGGEVMVEVVKDVEASGFCSGEGFRVGRVCGEDVMEEGTGGGLAAFCEPVSSQEDITIGAPGNLGSIGRRDERK